MSETQSSHQFAAATALRGQRIDTNDYELVIRQQPACGKVFLGREKDRKPIDPPPIVQLRVAQTIDRAQNYLQNPYYFVSCSVIDDDEGRPQKEKEELKTSLAGTLVSSLHRLKDVNNTEGGFFVFGDLSLRVEGIFRLQFILYEIRDTEVEYLKSVASEPFRVHPSKTWPGMAESTPLTRAFSDQGVRLRLRKEPRFRLQARGPASDNYERRRYNTSRRQGGQMESLPSAQQSQYLPLQQGYGGDHRHTRSELPGASQLTQFAHPGAAFGGSQFQTEPAGSLQQPLPMYPPSEEGYRTQRPIQSEQSGAGQASQYLPSAEGFVGGQRQFQGQYIRTPPFQQPLPISGTPTSRKRGHDSSDHSGGSYSSRESKRSRTDSESDSSKQPFGSHPSYALHGDPYGTRQFGEPSQPSQPGPFLFPQPPSQHMYSSSYPQAPQESLPRDQGSYFGGRRLDTSYASNPLPFEASATGAATSFRPGVPISTFPFGQAAPPSFPFQPHHVAQQQYASELVPGPSSITSQYGTHIYHQSELESGVRSEEVPVSSGPPQSYRRPSSTDSPQAGSVQFSPPTTESEAAYPHMWPQ